MIQPAPEVEPATGGRRAAPLLHDLAEHLRQNRSRLLAEWDKQFSAAPEPVAMSKGAILETAASVYDDYVTAVAAGRVETWQSYFARRLPNDLIESGVEAREVFHLIGLLRGMLESNVLDRSLFVKFRHA